jgi:precorrin-4/cobalt-precorrin-4 C11-methyltransferase
MIIFTMHTEFNELVEKLKTHYPADTPIAAVHAGVKSKVRPSDAGS